MSRLGDVIGTIVEINVSRMVNMPRFTRARSEFVSGSTTIDAIRRVDLSKLPGHKLASTSFYIDRSAVPPEPAKLGNITLNLDKNAFNDDVFSLKELTNPSSPTNINLSHESVHVSQILSDIGFSPKDVPYKQKPEEVEAVQLQQIFAERAARIIKHLSPTSNLSSKVTRTSSILKAVIKARREILMELRSARQDNSDDSQIVTELAQEYRGLQAQVSVLRQRLINLSPDTEQPTEEGTDL